MSINAPITILSFGGGVQSTALAILAAQKKIHVDAIVFCDTGFEQSIVFEFLETHTKPMLDKAGIPFFIAKTEDYAATLHGESTFANLELPPFFSLQNGDIGREPAFCSSKWKADVFKRFVSKEFKNKNFLVSLGFSTDEIQRAARIKNKKKYVYQFPLLDLKMNRTDCMILVEKTFNAEPPRSSCYFCPNHTQVEWQEVMQSKDKQKLIEFDNGLRAKNRFLTADCKPITECDFDPKNESIFSRLCAGQCFL